MARKDTKQHILDAAERLFAKDGYHCTPLRTITKEADANLAAVNYHFGSKKELLQATIERRLLPLNKVRVKRLEAVREKAEYEQRAPEAREVLLAFIEPTFAFRDSGQGAKDFIGLVGRSFSEPDDTVRTIFMHLIEPLFTLLSEMLSESLPGLPKNVFGWRLHFTIGAMAHTMHMACRNLSSPISATSATDTASLVDMYLKFVVSGLEAPT